MDCSKEKKGNDYDGNREIQKEIEKYIEVDPGVNLICLGDINGKLKTLEPNIEKDCNEKMGEKRTEKLSLHPLNQSRKCEGKYIQMATQEVQEVS